MIEDFETVLKRWAAWRALKDELAAMHPRAVVQDHDNGPICTRPDYLSDPERRTERARLHEASDAEAKEVDDQILYMSMSFPLWGMIIHARYMSEPGKVTGDRAIAERIRRPERTVIDIRARAEGWLMSRWQYWLENEREKNRRKRLRSVTG